MKILFATDGQPAAEAAGSLLTRMARREETEITALTVAQPESFDRDAWTTGVAYDWPAEAEEIAAHAAAGFARAGFDADVAVGDGYPAAEVIRYLERDGYDLVVVGAGNKSRWDRFLHGSTSRTLLHAAAVPVLVAHRAAPEGPVDVIVAEDGSPEAHVARDLFARLADPGRCRVTVVTVTTPVEIALVPSLSGIQTATVPLDPAQFADLEHDHIAEASARAETVAIELRNQGFTANPCAVLGHPIDELLRAAYVRDSDLVVMGTRGRKAITRMIAGSVSDEVGGHAAAALVARRNVFKI